MATANRNSRKDNGVETALVVGTALVAAAGAFFLYGSKDASKNRKTVKGWALRAKADVLEGIEKAKELHKEDYFKMVDNAVRKYAALRNVADVEISQVTRDLKSGWDHISKTVKGKPKARTSNTTPKAKTTKPKATKKTTSK